MKFGQLLKRSVSQDLTGIQTTHDSLSLNNLIPNYHRLRGNLEVY